MPDIFLSYSRKDKEFVRKLHEALAAQQRDIWVDWEDIPLTADWRSEIQKGIEGADTFVFVISPDSVRSEVCREEIEHAVALQKRFVPVLYREIVEDGDKEKTHVAINSHNWIFFRDEDDFPTTFDKLTQSIDTDLSYVQQHTRLLLRAKEWDNDNRDPSLLLRGTDLH